MLQGRRWAFSLILLGITAIWGATFVLVQDAIATLPPFTFLALRFGCATLILLMFLLIDPANTGNRRPRSIYQQFLHWHTLRNGMVLGVFLFLGYALQTFSLLYTTPGKSGFLTGLSVTAVPLLAWLILRTRPTRVMLIGVGLATLGLYLLAFVNLNTLNPGDVLAFLCALAFALQVIYTAKYARQAAIQHLVILQLGTVTLLSTLAALVSEPWQIIFQSTVLLQPTVLSALIITAVFATALAYLAQTHIQQHLTPTAVALVFACEPVFAALADFLWNGNTLSLRALLGCLLILGGTLLTEIKFPQWKVLER